MTDNQQHPYGPFGIPNARELASLPSDIALVEATFKAEYPDVDPTPERRRLIEAYCNVLRAAHAYVIERSEG